MLIREKKGESIKRKEKEEESKKKREEEEESIGKGGRKKKEEKEGGGGEEEGALAYHIIRPKPPFLKNNERFFGLLCSAFFSSHAHKNNQKCYVAYGSAVRIVDCGESTKWTNAGAATTSSSRTSLSFAVAVRRRFARPPILRPRARSLICEQRVPIAVPAPYTTGDGVRLSPSFVVIVVVVVVRVAPAARGSARRPRDARQPRSTTARHRESTHFEEN